MKKKKILNKDNREKLANEKKRNSLCRDRISLMLICYKETILDSNVYVPQQTRRPSNRPRPEPEPAKNRRSDFSIEPTVYLQLKRRKTDQWKIDRLLRFFYKKLYTEFMLFLPDCEYKLSCIVPYGPYFH